MTQDAAVDLEVRRALLVQVMVGVWLAMAIGFIYAMSRLLLRSRPRMHRLRIAVVSTDCVLCLAAILATGTVLQELATH